MDEHYPKAARFLQTMQAKSTEKISMKGNKTASVTAPKGEEKSKPFSKTRLMPYHY
jgi:hypothetical protein